MNDVLNSIPSIVYFILLGVAWGGLIVQNNHLSDMVKEIKEQLSLKEGKFNELALLHNTNRNKIEALEKDVSEIKKSIEGL